MKTANPHLSIKNWSKDDRPREKLENLGARSLSNAELIAILIGSGTKTQSAVDVSKNIMQNCQNHLNNLGVMNIADLVKFNGIGKAKAITIIAAMELGKRKQTEKVKKIIKVKSSNDAYNYITSTLSDLPHEELWVLFLNRANHVISKERISQGGVTGTVADVKIIIKHATEKLASGIILAHNHPSGNLIASQADKNLTSQVKAACQLFDIKLLDHLIVGKKAYYSFTDEGQLA